MTNPKHNMTAQQQRQQLVIAIHCPDMKTIDNTIEYLYATGLYDTVEDAIEELVDEFSVSPMFEDLVGGESFKPTSLVNLEYLIAKWCDKKGYYFILQNFKQNI